MTTQRLEEYLQSQQVPFHTLAHPYAMTAQATANSAHIASKEMAKTVMIKLDGRLAMAVVPADAWVSFDGVRELTGARDVTLASEDEFKDRFPECEVGAMPPFGNLYGMDVLVADSLADDEQIAFNGGSHRELVQMDWRDFERLVQPRVAPITGLNRAAQH